MSSVPPHLRDLSSTDAPPVSADELPGISETETKEDGPPVLDQEPSQFQAKDNVNDPEFIVTPAILSAGFAGVKSITKLPPLRVREAITRSRSGKKKRTVYKVPQPVFACFSLKRNAGTPMSMAVLGGGNSEQIHNLEVSIMAANAAAKKPEERFDFSTYTAELGTLRLLPLPANRGEESAERNAKKSFDAVNEFMHEAYRRRCEIVVNQHYQRGGLPSEDALVTFQTIQKILYEARGVALQLDGSCVVEATGEQWDPVKELRKTRRTRKQRITGFLGTGTGTSEEPGDGEPDDEDEAASGDSSTEEEEEILLDDPSSMAAMSREALLEQQYRERARQAMFDEMRREKMRPEGKEASQMEFYSTKGAFDNPLRPTLEQQPAPAAAVASDQGAQTTSADDVTGAGAGAGAGADDSSEAAPQRPIPQDQQPAVPNSVVSWDATHVAFAYFKDYEVTRDAKVVFRHWFKEFQQHEVAAAAAATRDAYNILYGEEASAPFFAEEALQERVELFRSRVPPPYTYASKGTLPDPPKDMPEDFDFVDYVTEQDDRQEAFYDYKCALAPYVGLLMDLATVLRRRIQNVTGAEAPVSKEVLQAVYAALYTALPDTVAKAFAGSSEDGTPVDGAAASEEDAEAAEFAAAEAELRDLVAENTGGEEPSTETAAAAALGLPQDALAELLEDLEKLPMMLTQKPCSPLKANAFMTMAEANQPLPDLGAFLERWEPTVIFYNVASKEAIDAMFQRLRLQFKVPPGFFQVQVFITSLYDWKAIYHENLKPIYVQEREFKYMKQQQYSGGAEENIEEDPLKASIQKLRVAAGV